MINLSVTKCPLSSLDKMIENFTLIIHSSNWNLQHDILRILFMQSGEMMSFSPPCLFYFIFLIIAFSRHNISYYSYHSEDRLEECSFGLGETNAVKDHPVIVMTDIHHLPGRHLSNLSSVSKVQQSLSFWHIFAGFISSGSGRYCRAL